MPVRDRQILITDILSTVLGQKPAIGKSFDWFINKHTESNFGEHLLVIDNIFMLLKGNPIANQSKQTKVLNYDAYFDGQLNFIFEFDEFQHFSSARLLTLENYSDNLKLNFSIDNYKQLCKAQNTKADNYRYNKTTVDFNFSGGRTAQRAYLDCFRDLLPQAHGLRPTLRINQFEVASIGTNNVESCKKLEGIIKTKLLH